MDSSYFVGWGTLAAINAALANVSGRSPLGYFLASLVLGPLVTLFIAVTKVESSGRYGQADLVRGDQRRAG